MNKYVHGLGWCVALASCVVAVAFDRWPAVAVSALWLCYVAVDSVVQGQKKVERAGLTTTIADIHSKLAVSEEKITRLSNKIGIRL